VNTYVPEVASLQDGRDFADVLSPKLPFMFGMALQNPYYIRIIQHLVEGDTGLWLGIMSGCVHSLLLSMCH
jgi:hypothetical protein